MEGIAVIGHSVGPVTVAAWIHDYAPRIRGAVLATPAFRIRLYIPLAIRRSGWSSGCGAGIRPSYVKAQC